MMNNFFATDEEIKYAQDILLGKENHFSAEKIAVIKSNDSKDVVACPGSGKTTTLLAKLAILATRMPLEEGKGVCVLTHTNVAIDEIKSKLQSQADVLFSYPNYFGTIQGFIDKYLTIPYFNSINEIPISAIDDNKAITLMYKEFMHKTYDEKKCIWKEIEDRIDKKMTGKEKRDLVLRLQFDFINNAFCDVVTKKYYRKYKDTRPFAANPDSNKYKLVDSVQQAALGQGVLKYTDAYRYALGYVTGCKAIKEAISKRFKYLFVDEMQDCQQIQIDLLEQLFDKKSIVVQCFGDPHQAIYDESGAEGLWKVGRTMPIMSSLRFGDSIANVLKTVCDKENSKIKGNSNIPSLPPVLLVYSSPVKVLPKFASLVKECKIGEHSLNEIAQAIKNKDALHRMRIKAIGWIGKPNDKGKLCINSYFPQYDNLQGKSGNKKPKVLSDYLKKIPSFSAKQYGDMILTALSDLLNILGYCFDKEGKNIRYTKSRLLSYIKKVNESFYFNLKKRIGNWVLNIINTDEDVDTKVVEEIKDYIEKDLRMLFNFSLDNQDLRKFLQNSNNHVTKESNISNNIFHSDDVEIEVGTVHSVKGETHVATLYMETSFHDKCESEYFGAQLEGLPYKGNKKYEKQALRIGYVAMSRPQYLLCMAISKEHFEKLDKKLIENNWKIEFVD